MSYTVIIYEINSKHMCCTVIIYEVHSNEFYNRNVSANITFMLICVSYESVLYEMAQ